MPKARYECELCHKPLRNLGDAKSVHDRTCPGFRALHIQSVAHVHQRLAAAAAQVSVVPQALTPTVDMQMQIEEPPPEPQKYRKSGLPQRRCRVPTKFNDAAPPLPPRIRHQYTLVSSSEPEPEARPLPQPTPPHRPLPTWVQTQPNLFGLYKVYPRRPTHDPDKNVTLDDLYLAPQDTELNVDALPLPKEPWFYPFPNASVAHMMKYHVEEENPGSISGFDRLVHNILQPDDEADSDGVNLADLPRPFSTKKFLDDLDRKGVEPLGVSDKWIEGSVKLKLPCVGRLQEETNAPEFIVTNIHYRPLLDPIKEVLQGPLFGKLHTTPFSLRFDPTYDSRSPDTVSLSDPDSPLNSYGLPDVPHSHEEVFGEIYTSAAMLEAYQSLPQPPPPQSPDDPVESMIMAMMEWSDATHLAQFGAASLWPGYTFFGNHSKSFRAKPSSNAGFHQVSQLPDSIRDAYRQQYDCDMPDEVHTHLKRELIHRIWELLLSEDFMDAYDNGIKIRCWDGIVQLVFPRLFIYGADYPEKVLLATIRSLGGHPCPRCFVAKAQIAETGTVNDMKRRQVLRVDDHARRQTIEDARRAIFRSGLPVIKGSIDKMLKDKSWVPVRVISFLSVLSLLFTRRQNAFTKLNTEKTPFNFYTLFVPDLLHEVELGVAKAIITHLIRMLQTFKNVDEFDQRFRQVETFGRSVIRAFGHNVSGMKYAAARDFEDVLQCILPVVDGIFPMHQKLVDQLCFELAIWHGYAKLRMHTTTTIQLFRTATTDLLTTIRRFARETIDVKTYELPREERQRTKRASKAAAAATMEPVASAATSAPAVVMIPVPLSTSPGPSTVAVIGATTEQSPVPNTNQKPKANPKSKPKAKSKAKSKAKAPAEPSELPNAKLSSAAKTPQPKKDKIEKPFNLITYKLHSLADYPDTILRFGTTDSFSTQIGELAHRLVKHLYRRTNKRDHARQIAKHEHRRRLMRAMWERRIPMLEAPASTLRPQPNMAYGAYVPPEQHHYISDSRRTSWNLSDLAEIELDSDTGSDSDGPPLERMDVDQNASDPALQDFTLKLKSHFRQRLLQIDDPDIQFGPDDLLNVIVEKDLLRLYTHATMKVNYTTYDVRRDQDMLNPRTRRFFIVRSQDEVDPHPYWYGEILGIFHAHVLLADHPAKAKRIEFLWCLPRLHYMSHEDPNAFGFLDPQDVVRGTHLIPAFCHGETTDYLPTKSVARHESRKDLDWRYYYVNLMVDRDMIMRYHSNVVGHRNIVPNVQHHDPDPMEPDSSSSAIPDIDINTTEAAIIGGEEEEDEQQEDADWRADARIDSDSEDGGEAEDEPLTPHGGLSLVDRVICREFGAVGYSERHLTAVFSGDRSAVRRALKNRTVLSSKAVNARPIDDLDDDARILEMPETVKQYKQIYRLLKETRPIKDKPSLKKNKKALDNSANGGGDSTNDNGSGDPTKDRFTNV
ncbi:hypothetical protein MIND_01118900 [Mycena indigotica]|uniref:Uncharacterized protein n=1 Tax=Mycena indigotica TaxID=2126181 RepID=A0A8H6VTJ8_9AGAR|nr:uncharacterized protein MIND_01118900 [Mycena indigotica]KAF7293417.1 hypothetical protein MIND_01118900 [Mycena indigotica]